MRRNVIRAIALTLTTLGGSLLLAAVASEAGATDPLAITTSVTSGPTLVPITLSVNGGAGTGAVSLTVTGSGCVVTHSTVRSTAAGSCVVTAHKAAFKGVAAQSSSPVTFTFDHAPGNPLTPSVTAGDRSVTVSWAAPKLFGGSPLTGYRVTATPTVTAPSGCTDTLSTSCVFSGLAEGTKYTFKVTATNAAGTATSKNSKAVTPYAVVDGHQMTTRGNYTNVSFASGSNFAGLNLAGAKFAGAHLVNANFNGTTLTNANFGRAILTGAHVSNADFTGANLIQEVSGSLVGTPTALPDGWSVTVGYLVGPSANLVNAHLTSANLTGVDLSKATLTGVTSGNVSGTPTNLPKYWSLANGTLFGPSAVITGANLDGADLSTTALRGVVSGGLSGTPTSLPQNWIMANGYLVGPGANLANANLQSANLTGADVGGANLMNADLSGATLTGLRSGHVLATPALPDGWANYNGYLVGPGANLSGANLAGVDFESTTLDNIDFTDANMAGAIFNNCDVTGAIFSTATFTGVTSSGLTGTPAAFPDSTWSIVEGSFAQS
jgi:uncharacterized protein YjbI with pentapeptide repeats